jgi:hypothetical protein
MFNGENKYLRDFLNLLNDDQVFYSYLTNTFILNQLNVLNKELEQEKRSRVEIETDIQNLIRSVEIMIPEALGLNSVKVSKEDFYELVKTVRNQTIENLIERRKN